MKYIDIKNGRFYLGDCLEVMKQIPDGTVDMILADLPYGTTQNKWDVALPLEELWNQYSRICNRSIVLTATQPFSSVLVASNLKMFRYQWVWVKSRITGVLNAKKMPVRKHEQILIFSKNKITYNAQNLIRKGTVTKQYKGVSSNYGVRSTENYIQEFTNWPSDVLEIPSICNTSKDKFHPTQKPVALFEYLIKTYTNEGQLVLDNTAGSGTTAIAAINTNRKWICIEKDEGYANKAVERIWNHKIEEVANT